MPRDALHGREDLTKRASDRWPPPLFAPPAASARGRAAAALRRFFDLQAGSIWRDLSVELGRPHGLVLDVGSGAQPYRRLVHPGDTYRAIDTADAEEHFGYRAADTTYFSGDRWPVEDSTVDLVLSTETLEHVRDPDRFMAEAARVAKPGATLLLTVPFSARWHFIPHDYWRFTPSSLSDLLERHGFTDIAVYGRGDAVTVACDKAMGLIRPLLLPHARGAAAAIGLRLLGVLFLPALLVLAVIANVSLRSKGGDDCLGYTVVARRV